MEWSKRCLLVCFVILLLVSCVNAGIVTKPSILKTIENTDKITEADITVELNNGRVVSELHTDSKNIVTNTLKKIGVVQPISKTLATKEGVEKVRVSSEYIEDNINIIGKSSIISNNIIMNITIHNQSYDYESGMNKFNITATLNGKSLLIHNPFMTYGIPHTVKQTVTETTYLDPLTDFNTIVAPTTIYSNGTKTFASELITAMLSEPITKEVEIEVDSPTDAVLQNLAYVLATREYGEPTFDDPDPTTTFYTSGNWVPAATTYTADVTLVGGGGGATYGYMGIQCRYDYNPYPTGCSMYNVIEGPSENGAGGSASTPVYLTEVSIIGGTTYPIIVGVGGARSGGGFDANACLYGCSWNQTLYCNVKTESASNGGNTIAFSNTSVGGIGGSVTGPWNQKTPNHASIGDNGLIMSPTVTGGNGGTGYAEGSAGGIGYGAGGGGGGETGPLVITHYGPPPAAPFNMYYHPGTSGAGGAGAPGIVIITYTNAMATASWGSPLYSIGESGVYTYAVDTGYWTPEAYSYSIEIINDAFPLVSVVSKTITTRTGTELFLFDEIKYDVGTYTGYLRATNRINEAVQNIASATTQISGIVRVKGFVINAVTGDGIDASNVDIVQSATSKNVVTPANGSYDTTPTEFVTSISLAIDATKSGYHSHSVTFVPLSSAVIDLNISLIPTSATTGNVIGGIVGQNPYGQPIPNATVVVKNATQTLTNTSNAYGFYFVSGIAPGTSYTVSSTKTNFTPSIDYTVSAGSGFTSQNTRMNGTYRFTGRFVDSSTGNVIPSVTVSDNTGYTIITSSGTFANDYPYGDVIFTFSAASYTYKTVTYTITADVTTNITMSQAASVAGQTMYFTPKKVRFFCRDLFGKPIVNMTARVYGVETTLGALDWVVSLFGINLDTIPITSTLMTGTTGSDGSIIFVMMDTEKYSIQYISPENNINETRYYYPKQEEYIEVFWPETNPASSTIINGIFTNTTINSTYTLLGVTYSDTLGTTDKFTFYIDNNTMENGIFHQHRVYTQHVNNSALTVNVTVNHTVPNIVGGGYFWGYTSNSTSYGDRPPKARYLAFEDKQWLINPMGAANGDITATTVYNAAAVGVVVIFALIFGRVSIKFGVVIVPLMGLVFWRIGWLEVSVVLIAMAIALGILMYLRFSEEEY